MVSKKIINNMKNNTIILLLLVGIIQFNFAQKYIPVTNTDMLEKHQLIIEHSYPADFNKKLIDNVYSIDDNHTIISYKQVNDLYTEDLVHNDDGEFNIIANFTELKDDKIPAIVKDAYKKLNKAKALKYFLVEPTYQGPDYYAIQTAEKRFYFSRMGVQLDPPR